MSYVLDGIPTAMVKYHEGGHDLAGHREWVECPCGFRSPMSSFSDREPDPAALRFHYTHCPKAKKETPDAN